MRDRLQPPRRLEPLVDKLKRLAAALYRLGAWAYGLYRVYEVVRQALL